MCCGGTVTISIAFGAVEATLASYFGESGSGRRLALGQQKTLLSPLGML